MFCHNYFHYKRNITAVFFQEPFNMIDHGIDKYAALKCIIIFTGFIMKIFLFL